VGEVVVTEDLARTLEVGPGDVVSTYLYGSKTDLEIARLLPRLGLAGFNPSGNKTTSPNAFVAPGTLTSSISPEDVPEGAMPPHSRVLISNRGGVEEGAALTERVTKLIRNALPPAAAGLDIEELKKDRLDNAESSGKYFSQIFVAIGSFGVVAGILLLVSIFVMLAEERKGQLGMLRAVGMRRSDLVRGFVIEGAMYALVAGALGAVLGIGVGWGIVKLATPIFSSGEDFSLDLQFTANSASVVAGLCIGALIALVTVVLTSLRISRVNIIRAIRDLPEPGIRKARRRTMVAGAGAAVLGALWFVSGLSTEEAWPAVILGPVLVSVGLLPIATRVIGRRTGVMTVASAALAWGLFGNAITGGKFFESDSMVPFVVQGVLITFSAVVLLSQAQDLFQGAIRRFAARYLSLRLGTAYPIAHRFRTGLTLGMYSLVIFTLVFVAVLTGVFSTQIDESARKISGGFDVLASSSTANPPDAERLAEVPGVERVVSTVSGLALFDRSGDTTQWSTTGIDSDFISQRVPKLEERDEQFASDRAAWEALVADPKAIIVSPFFLHTGGDMVSIPDPGDSVTSMDPQTGKRIEHVVLGILESDPTLLGAVMNKEATLNAAPGNVSPSRFYIDVDGSEADARGVTSRLQGDFIANGVDADTFRSIAEDQQQQTVQFLRLMQGFLALGLVVGIAGLGVVMVRAVRERRKEIGVLRSLGFLPQRIRRAFLLESSFIALEGVLIGALLALVTGYQGVTSGDFGDGVSFAVPWAEVALLGGIAFLASLLATAWPARQASRIPPAVALRIAD
jgi:putative ABC transport system permease protein